MIAEVELGAALNWVDFVSLVLLAGFFIYGVVRGFMLQLAGIVVLVLAIVAASIVSDPLGQWLKGKFPDLPFTAAKYICFGIVFVVAAGIGMGLSHLLRGGLEKAKVLAYDRLLGGALGLVKAALILILITQLTLHWSLREDEEPPGIPKDLVTSKTGQAVKWSSEKILVFLPKDFSQKLRNYEHLN